MVSGELRTRYEDVTDADGRRITKVTDYDPATGKIVNVRYRTGTISTPYGTRTTPTGTATYTQRPSITEIKTVSDGSRTTRTATTDIKGKPQVISETDREIIVGTPIERRITTTTTIGGEDDEGLTTEKRVVEAGQTFLTSAGISFAAAKIGGTSALAGSVVSGAGILSGGGLLGGVGAIFLKESGLSNRFEDFGRSLSSNKDLAGFKENTFLKNIEGIGKTVFEDIPEGIKRTATQRPELIAATLGGGIAGTKLAGKIQFSKVFKKGFENKQIIAIEKQSSFLSDSKQRITGAFKPFSEKTSGAGKSIFEPIKIQKMTGSGFTGQGQITVGKNIQSIFKSTFFDRQTLYKPFELPSFRKGQIGITTAPSVKTITRSRLDFASGSVPSVLEMPSKRLSSVFLGAAAIPLTKEKQFTRSLTSTKTDLFKRVESRAVPKIFRDDKIKITPDTSITTRTGTRTSTLIKTLQLTEQVFEEPTQTKEPTITDTPITTGLPPSLGRAFGLPQRERKGKKKKKKRRRTTGPFGGYAPSLGGLLAGGTIPKIPKVITGVGVRKKVRRKKKRGKRK